MAVSLALRRQHMKRLVFLTKRENPAKKVHSVGGMFRSNGFCSRSRIRKEGTFLGQSKMAGLRVWASLRVMNGTGKTESPNNPYENYR
jgi:hypothetical protein